MAIVVELCGSTNAEPIFDKPAETLLIIDLTYSDGRCLMNIKERPAGWNSINGRRLVDAFGRTIYTLVDWSAIAASELVPEAAETDVVEARPIRFREFL
jgi:hypothetical protein